MHIALKKIQFDLQRFLPRGSEEQIEDIYNIAKDEYYRTEKGIKELAETKKSKELASKIDNINNGVADKIKSGRPKKQEVK
jgi:hypothetical protein